MPRFPQHPIPHRCASALAAIIAATLPAPVAAGASLEEAMRLHREALDPGGRHAADELPADSFVLAIAPRRLPGPVWLARPVRGETGVQWQFGGGSAAGPLWRLGGIVLEHEPHRFDLDGSELSVPAGPGRVYASVQRRHWGPAWTGSLVLDGAARAVPAVGWRKVDAAASASPWLSWLGRWRGDAFVGQLSNPVGPARVKLVAARLELMPWSGVEFGLSRALQWGGEGRPESARSLLDGMLGRDNIDGDDRRLEPGNQLGGFDARLTVSLGEGASARLYGQAIGEDEAGALPSRYLGSAGIDAAWRPAAGLSLRAFAEAANTVAGGAFGRAAPGVAYRHPLYEAGYAHRGEPLGHPAGADARIASAGLLADAGHAALVLMVHRGRVIAPTARIPVAGPLRGLNADVSLHLPHDFALGASLAHWRDASGRSTGLQLQWRVPLR